MNKWLFFIGMLLLVLPIGWKIQDAKSREETVDTYEKQLQGKLENQLQDSKKSATQYNQKLYETGIVDLKRYETELNLSKTGMMGSIRIPKIALKLPIYHGTSEEVLAQGIGHLQESSLPIGGENSHCVLSGHRGVPNMQLFTRLDELVTGDCFEIRVHGEQAVYRIIKIRVVKPEETDCLKIQKGKDLVSLVTCTPYGINTHRLILTGERVETKEEETTNGTRFSVSDGCILLMPAAFFIFGGIRKRKKRIKT